VPQGPYPNPAPTCSACEKPVHYMLRRRCRKCRQWSHAGCCPRNYGDHGYGGVCLKCRDIKVDADGKYLMTPGLIKSICFDLCFKIQLFSEEEKQVALILLMAAMVSKADEFAVIRDTGLNADFVSTVAKRLREAKIWVDDQIDMEWDDPDPEKGGDIIFILHVACGMGNIVRTFKPDVEQEQPSV
jgi:hypothetical protein